MPLPLPRGGVGRYATSKVLARATLAYTVAARLLSALRYLKQGPRLSVCLAAVVFATAPWQSASGAPQCMLAVEKIAFDVRVLQTQLMIAALSCGQHDEYNVFVLRHRRTLLEADQLISAHFTRLYGQSGEQQHDEYITTLANALSQDGIDQGPYFCRDVRQLVLASLTLHNSNEMSRFVSESNIANPYALEVCEPAPDRSIELKLSDLIRRQSELVHGAR